MAYNDEWQERLARQEKEREEQLEQLKLEKQLTIKKMTKLVTGSIIGLFLMVFLFKSCERIDAGHVGVKVNQYGDNKGVDDVVAKIYISDLSLPSTRIPLGIRIVIKIFLPPSIDPAVSYDEPLSTNASRKLNIQMIFR